MDYIAQPKDYWIATNAINITRNALGKPNRIQCSVVSGAAILCYIEGVDGLGYDNGHRFRTWPLTISPTYFNSNTEKYVYVAIPRSAAVGTRAVVVFPSEQLDIYGVNANDEQVGSTDYYYIWLQGILTATDGTSNREWQQTIDFGKKGTDEDLYDDTSSEWFQYSKVNNVVTFLKNIRMKAGTTFQNLILGNKELTGVATSDIAYTDSDALVATPGYVENQYLSKTHESEAQEQIGFLKGLWVGVRNLYEITANGIAKLKSVIAEDVTATRIQTDRIISANYTGDGVSDTGFRLTNSHNGHSKLTIDEIYVRMKAVFESLEVRERTYTGGDQIWSCAGNQITRVDYLGNVETADHVPQMMNVHADGRPSGQGQGDIYSVPVPGDTYGYSDVKVPWLLRQMPLLARAKVFARYRKVRIVINEPESNPTNRAAASESPLANIRRARCYFIAKDDDMEVHNWWRINDLARCQTMNLANTTRQTYLSGEDEKAGNIFWWRKVIGVSYEPVTLEDGKQYHYFDVSFDYELEKSQPAAMATSVMEGSDIPAAHDSVVQFGNTIIEGRMNLMMMEVNGSDSVGYNPSTDAPCLKAYRGVYCFDLTKSWVGGNARKMMLSPKSGYEFYGPNFKQVTEYDVVPVPVDRGLWTGITPTRDDYREHALVRKCYYYDKVSHNGSYWLCSIVDGAHWVNGDGNYISDADYSALTEEQKALCSRKQNYTIEEPSVNSIDWTEVVQKGDKGSFKSRVFCRTNSAPDTPQSNTPTGTSYNTYNNPVPPPVTGQPTWTDGIPQGTAILWSSVCTFYANGTNSGWSTPAPETDTADLDIEFSPSTSEPSVPQGNTPFADHSSEGWYDPSHLPVGQTMIWRAERKVKNGVYNGGWVITRIYGEKGDNMIRLDISNEMDMIPTTAALRIDVARTVETTVRLFDGATEVDISAATLSPTGGPASSIATFSQAADGKGKKLSWAFNAGQTMAAAYEISISYTYKSVTYTAVFTVSASKGEAVWQLKPSLSAIPFQRNADNTLTPASRAVGLSLVKIDGGSTATYTSVQAGLTVRYSYSSMPSSASAGTGWESGNITVANTADNLYIALFNASGTLLDRETIPVIKDGENGQNGSDGPYYVEDYGIGASRTSHSDISSWSSSQPEPTAQKPYVWKRSRLYDPNTQTYGNATYVCLTGERGANGKDGWMITANPSNVIITQALGNDTTQFSTVKVGFTAKKGSVSATVNSLAIPTGQQALSNEFNAAIGTGDDAKKVIVSSPKTYTPQGGTAQYYTEGTFVVDVNVTDPDTNTTVTFSVTVPCYANLLGTWKRSVEAGEEAIAASKIEYVFSASGSSIESIKTDYNSKRNSIGNYETWSSEENTQEGSKKWMNQHINTAEGKISTIRRNAVTRNLLGRGQWKSSYPGTLASYEAKNDRWYDDDVNDLYSPAILLQKGRYCFYCYVPSNRYFSSKICMYKLKDGNMIIVNPYYYGVIDNDTVTINGNVYHRCYAQFELNEDINYVINVYGDSVDEADIAVPCLCEGETPSIETSMSMIRQTADNIELKVKECGINIDDKEIDLTAGKVNFKMPGGGTNPKISIDPTTGTLHAVDGKFSGNIYTPYKRLTSNNIGEYETEDFYGDTVINLAKTGLNLQVEVSRETPTQAVHISLPKITADMLGCEVNIFNVSGDVIEINGSGRAGQSSSGGFMTALVKPSVGLGTNTTLNLNAGYEAKLKAIHNPYMIQHENYQYSWLCCYANINP